MTSANGYIKVTNINSFIEQIELKFNYNQFAYLVKQVIPDALPILVRVK